MTEELIEQLDIFIKTQKKLLDMIMELMKEFQKAEPLIKMFNEYCSASEEIDYLEKGNAGEVK